MSAQYYQRLSVWSRNWISYFIDRLQAIKTKGLSSKKWFFGLFFIGLVGLKSVQLAYKKWSKQHVHSSDGGHQIQNSEEILKYYKSAEKSHILDMPSMDQVTLDSIVQGNSFQIKQMIHDGVVSCETVTKIHIGQLLNQTDGIVYINFDAALAKAKLQDQVLAKDKNIIHQVGNEYFGIPFVIPHFNQKASPLKHKNLNTNINDLIRKQKGIILAESTKVNNRLFLEVYQEVTGKPYRS